MTQSQWSGWQCLILESCLLQALDGLPVSICWHWGSGALLGRNSCMRNIFQLHNFTRLLKMASLSSWWWQQRPWSPLQGMQKCCPGNCWLWRQGGTKCVWVSAKFQSLSKTHLELNLSFIKAANSSLRSKVKAWQLCKGVSCCAYFYKPINALKGLLQK